ncbi:MAG: histidine kinase N-terminal 7TM domain-containing protein [Acidobacteriota bacterium]
MHSLSLLLGAGLALWVAGCVWGGAGHRGRRVFTALMLAVAWWCLTSAVHGIVEPLGTKVLVAQVQYLAVASVPALWLVFAGLQAERAWARSGRAWVLALPGVATAALAWTNGAHGLVWREIVAVDAGRVVYVHGAWYYVFLAFNYACVLAGTWLLVGTARRGGVNSESAPYLLTGVFLPWVFNGIYHLRLIPVSGLDLTPLGLAASSVFLLWGIYRQRLPDLVPLSRAKVIDRLSDAVLVLDAEERIVDHNPAARALPEAARGRLIGRRVRDVFPWWEHLNCTSGGRSSSQVVLTVDQGATFLEVDALPVDGRAGSRGSVVTLRDISVRRRTEEEIRALRLRMEEQQRLEGLTVLTAGLGREIRDLLQATIAGLIRVGHAGPGVNVTAEVDAALGAARRGLDLAERMLRESAPGEAIERQVDLDEVVRDVLTLLSYSAPQQRKVVYRREGALGLTVSADSDLIRQAVFNAVMNACEATEEWDVVRVSTGVEELTLADTAEAVVGKDAAPGSYAFVEVADTGPGMTAAMLLRATEPFTSTKRKGRGLGLPSLINIIRAHRGVLKITSAPGAGTVVRAWLPRAAAGHEGA